MRIRPKYITTLLVAGAAAAAIAAAPTAVAAPASAQPAGIATAPIDGHGGMRVSKVSRGLLCGSGPGVTSCAGVRRGPAFWDCDVSVHRYRGFDPSVGV